MRIALAQMKMEHPYIKGIRDACRENGIYASPNLYIEENS